jgi:membrane-bound metal-dependent hydrolase YbcI (DUF457 family)
MFIAHYAVAFGAKRAAPRASLGVLVAAAQWLDLVWPIFLLVGWERVAIVPKLGNPFATLEFTSYPWSHSLLASCVWGAALALAYWLRRRDRRGAVVIAALVVSHWVLDLVAHRPDLPLAPGGGPRLGLGLWRSVAATLVVEALLFVAGVLVYAQSTRPVDRVGRFGFWALVTFLVLLYVANATGSPPPNVRALAWTALAGWLLPLWAWWVDRHRRVSAEAQP